MSGVQSVGDTVPAGPAVANIQQISNALEEWIDEPATIVLYDDGDQQNGYQICGFEIEVMRDQGGGPMPESVGLLQNLEVHAIILPVATVDESAEAVNGNSEGGVFRTSDDKGQSVLLAVDPQDALTIRHILDVGGELDLALRGPDDETIAGVEPVDQFYLADRYNIELVRNGAGAQANSLP